MSAQPNMTDGPFVAWAQKCLRKHHAMRYKIDMDKPVTDMTNLGTKFCCIIPPFILLLHLVQRETAWLYIT